MVSNKHNIIDQLRQHIFFLQGFKKSSDRLLKINLGVIDQAFPNESFPLEAVHEFLTEKIEDVSATNGFVMHIISQLMNNNGMCIWVSSSQTVFPAALKVFNIDADKFIFIHVQNQKERLWVIEETLKCEGLCAVVGEVKELGFTESRRFQLAVEQSKVTGFIIRNQHCNPTINTCVSRWKISPLPSGIENNLPGVGYSRWNIELLRIRNGKPRSWQMEYSDGKLHPIPIAADVNKREVRRKAV